MVRFAIALFPLVPLAGCGGLTGATNDSLDSGETGGEAAVEGGPRVRRAPDCPDELPESGASCAPSPWLCEYGTDPHCTTYATCSGAWTLSLQDPSCHGNPSGCPAAFDAGAGGGCPVASSCTYPEGRCGCIPCSAGIGCPNQCGPAAGDAGVVWSCQTWLPAPGCPTPRPLLGTACGIEGQECGQPSCCVDFDVDPAMVCTNGFWREVTGMCF